MVPEPVDGPTVNQEAYEDELKIPYPNGPRFRRDVFRLREPIEADGTGASPI